MKKRLTQSEEFEIMKLILDKFLWLGFIVMAYGFYLLVSGGIGKTFQAVGYIFSGVLLLGLFVLVIVKEYEILK
jgi:hypothetical protein